MYCMKLCNYHLIHECDLSNGEGVRLSLFLSGCSHGCKGCYNKKTWNPTSGEPLTYEIIDEILERCADHDGISITGGDPLHRRNRSTVRYLVDRFTSMYPTKDIWLWTGYKIEDIRDQPEIRRILSKVDVLIDGKYEKDNPTTKPWRGSDNQRLIKIKEI